MKTVINIINNTTRINIEELSLLLAQQGIQMINTHKDIDITLDRQARTLYININRILMYENSVSLDIVFDLVRDGYFGGTVVNSLSTKFAKRRKN